MYVSALPSRIDQLLTTTDNSSIEINTFYLQLLSFFFSKLAMALPFLGLALSLLSFSKPRLLEWRRKTYRTQRARIMFLPTNLPTYRTYLPCSNSGCSYWIERHAHWLVLCPPCQSLPVLTIHSGRANIDRYSRAQA